MIDTPPGPDPATAPRRRVRWIAAALAAAVLVVAGVVVTWRSGSQSAAATATTVASAGPPVTPASLVSPRPSASAPTSDWQEWIGQEAAEVLKRQTAALLAGDFPAYVADAVPGAKAELGRRFRSLRALQVTRFDQRPDGNPWPPSRDGGTWRLVTIADHCFVETDCAADLAVFDSMWQVTPEGVRLAGFHTHDRASPCFKCPLGVKILTRPWETTELAAQAGRRSLVAVPIAYRGRLAELSRQVEAAAAIADRYTVGDGKVDRYRVFLADPKAWKLWYDGFPGTWVAGQAVATGADRIETEILVSQLTSAFGDQLLRHELAHVSTLRNNSFYGRDDVWWLVEGMGDHVQHDGDAAGAALERQDLHRFLRSHQLSSVVVRPPAAKASLADAAGRYAVGYFALRHLIAKYGRSAVLSFFQQAVQQGIGLDTASRSALGKPWAKVDRECAAGVRNS